MSTVARSRLRSTNCARSPARSAAACSTESAEARSPRSVPRRRDLLERLALGVDAMAQRYQPGGDHEQGAEAVAGGHRVAAAGADQPAEQQRRDEAAGAGPDRIEHRDREAAHL